MKPVSHNSKIKAVTLRLLVVVATTILGLSSTHAKTTGTIEGASSEDFRATKAALVWVVGDPKEPRASLIRKLPKGGVVSVLSTHENWVRVAIVDGSGQGGYVLAGLLKKASQGAIDNALVADQHNVAYTDQVGNNYGTSDDNSGYRQASVPKVWVVGDPEKIYETLIRKLEQGEAIRVLSQGEIWSKVQLSGSGESGFVMNRWTIPASFLSIRNFLSAPKIDSPKAQASKTKKSNSIAPPVKAPYLIKTAKKEENKSPQKQEAQKTKPASSQANKPVAKSANQEPALQMAGVGMPGLPFQEKNDKEQVVEEEEESTSLSTTALIIVFGLSAIGLFILFILRRSKHILGDGAMDCLGKIKIDSKSVLTLVRVPGKLLVMLKTPEGVDILREIKTSQNVAPAEARKILHESFVGQLPTKPKGSRVERAASMDSLSPAEALAMGAGASFSKQTRRSDHDPLQARLGSARARMRQVMGVS